MCNIFIIWKRIKNEGIKKWKKSNWIDFNRRNVFLSILDLLYFVPICDPTKIFCVFSYGIIITTYKIWSSCYLMCDFIFVQYIFGKLVFNNAFRILFMSIFSCMVVVRSTRKYFVILLGFYPSEKILLKFSNSDPPPHEFSGGVHEWVLVGQSIAQIQWFNCDKETKEASIFKIWHFFDGSKQHETLFLRLSQNWIEGTYI